MDLANTIYTLDSATIDLYLTVFPWAHFRRTKCAVMVLEEDGTSCRNFQNASQCKCLPSILTCRQLVPTINGTENSKASANGRVLMENPLANRGSLYIRAPMVQLMINIKLLSFHRILIVLLQILNRFRILRYLPSAKTRLQLHFSMQINVSSETFPSMSCKPTAFGGKLPTATSWSNSYWVGFAPTRKTRLTTAHAKDGLSDRREPLRAHRAAPRHRNSRKLI